MLNHLSALLAGFSIVSTIILLMAYLFFLDEMRKSLSGKIACAFVLVPLALLQIAHYLYFTEGLDLLSYRAYCFLLVMIPPAFYFFGREVLFPEVAYRWWNLLHLLPAIISFGIAIKYVPAFSFLFGTAYTCWFARLIYRLKDQRGRFKFEFFFFGMFAVIALMALTLGFSLPYMDVAIFYHSYSVAISLSMILIVSALLVFPELLNDMMLATELAYAKSKLLGINTQDKLDELDHLMTKQKHYENEDLSLAITADLLGLTSHQLSELINTHHGYSFPRFVREHRIKAAKYLLVSDPKASVLSISMMTGFKSQSAFYTAFKELTGISPGSFRGQHID